MPVPEVQDARDRLDGLMLGDGGLVRRVGRAYYHMMLSKQLVPVKEKSEANRIASLAEHLKWERLIVDDVFTPLGIVVSPEYPKIRNWMYLGQPWQSAFLFALQSPLLTELYDEWYAGGEWVQDSHGSWRMHGATKVLPQRLMKATELPILTLVEWFLGDGSSYWGWNKGSKRWRLFVYFSTYNFSIKGVFHLAHMLNNMGVVTRKLSLHKEVKKGSGLAIYLSTADNHTDHFMRLTQPAITEMFGDSESPSYKDMIKWKDYPPGVPLPFDFGSLRNRLKGGANHAST